MNILLDAVQYSNKSVMISLLAKYGQLKMNQVYSDLLLTCATSVNLIIYYMWNKVRLPKHEEKNWQKCKSKLIFDCLIDQASLKKYDLYRFFNQPKKNLGIVIFFRSISNILNFHFAYFSMNSLQNWVIVGTF